MTSKAKRALVLYDLPEPIFGHDQASYLLEHDDRPTERDVARAIKRLGFSLNVHGVFDDVTAIWHKVQQLKPDFVFNLCETFRGNRAHEGDVASLLELAGVSYTGSGPAALHLCKDKGATKKIAVSDGVRVPAFVVARCGDPMVEPFQALFPLIVKPLNREASEGISQASLVYDWESCAERVRWVASKFGADVIVEEYIHGRELYVGVLDTEFGPKSFSPRELFFAKIGKSEPMVATYRAKWDDAYRERWGISTGKAVSLTEPLRCQLMDDSVRLFKSLGLKGYARLDWRLPQVGEPVLLEANPNPALSQDDDFAKAAKTDGLSFTELIATISHDATRSRKYRDLQRTTQWNPRCSATTRPITSKDRSSA